MKFTHNGLNVRARMIALCRTDTNVFAAHFKVKLPGFTMHRKREHRGRSYVTGRAIYRSNRIHLTLTGNPDRAEIETVLVHELAHLVAGYDRKSAFSHHGPHYNAVFTVAMREAYGSEIKAPGVSMIGYAQTHALLAKLREARPDWTRVPAEARPQPVVVRQYDRNMRVFDITKVLERAAALEKSHRADRELTPGQKAAATRRRKLAAMSDADRQAASDRRKAAARKAVETRKKRNV